MATNDKGTLPGTTKRPAVVSNADAAGRLPTQSGITPTSQTASRPDSAPDDLHGRTTIETSSEIAAPNRPATLNVPIPGAIEARIAAITTAGGLMKLPDGFGDRGGDWASVRGRSAFEILFLDWRQAERITPEMVARHRALLTAFWTETIGAMTQGSGRVSVPDLYGGEHRSAELVQSYLPTIEQAFSRLSTREDIAGAYKSLFLERQDNILARLDEQLTVCLFDKALQPAETRALFEFADREGIARDLVATHVANRLVAEQILPIGPVSGATGAERLLSTTWAHDSVKPKPPDTPKPRNRFVPVFLFSIAVVLVLVVSSALWSRRTAATAAGSVVQPSTSTQALPTGRVPEEPQLSPVQTTKNRPIEKPRASGPVSKNSEPTTPPAVTPVVSAEQRRAVHNRIEAIRRLADSDPKAAVEQVTELDSGLAEHENEYASERLEVANIRGQLQSILMEQRLTEERTRAQQETDARAQQERDKQWEQRLAQIDSLSKQGNYSGAKSLADQLLGEPNLPQPIATRAKGLSDDAVAQLQKIFSDTKVNAKTTRSPHG